MVKDVSDHAHKELQPDEVFEIFKEKFLNVKKPYELKEVHYVQKNGGIIGATLTLSVNGEDATIYAEGNGRLDAVSNGIKAMLNTDFTLTEYTEHAVQYTSKSDAVSYISVEKDGKVFWGVGLNSDITTSSVLALISAVNGLAD